MLNLGYLDNNQQINEFTNNDYVESSSAIVKKIWMDTKRKKSKKEKAKSAIKIFKISKSYKPDLIFLGDDNAARYIGNQFLDSEIPVVFWGVNNTPVKYGLVDEIENPGHNVTGVYQPGYFLESLQFLKAVAPQTKTFALLSDASTSGRNHVKKIEHLSRKQKLPLKLIDVVSINDFEEWKKQVLKLKNEVDAFFLAQYSGIIDGSGNSIPAEKVAAWYLENVDIPEAVGQGQFVKQGMLCGADDSGYNQGYEAVLIAHDILTTDNTPSNYPPRVPKRGPLLFNKQRADMLGIKPTPAMGIEKYLE